ncbi:MAG TPA: DUF5395 family protein [Myxococcota bacterium]|nr:DUF5395 family protein [Myxococcota bacterium]
MRADLEMVISCDADRWVAKGDELVASGATWDELEEDLRRGLASSERYASGTRVTVWMGCDGRMIPEWMRPYQCHYFNRVMHLQI